MPKSRGRQPKSKSLPPPPPPRPRWRWMRATYAVFVFLIGIGGAGWGLYAKIGPYWPTEPEITPGAAGSPESSPVSPFLVKNNGVVFSMEDVRFTCFLNGALFKIGDEKGWVMAKIGPPKPGTWWKKSDEQTVGVPPGKSVNYFCGPDEMMRDVRLNAEPARLRGMQVQISMDYVVKFPLYAWHRHYDSDVFTCDVDSGSCRWFIGAIVH
jgi:hypothetical protein